MTSRFFYNCKVGVGASYSDRVGDQGTIPVCNSVSVFGRSPVTVTNVRQSLLSGTDRDFSNYGNSSSVFVNSCFVSSSGGVLELGVTGASGTDGLYGLFQVDISVQNSDGTVSRSIFSYRNFVYNTFPVRIEVPNIEKLLVNSGENIFMTLSFDHEGSDVVGCISYCSQFSIDD